MQQLLDLQSPKFEGDGRDPCSVRTGFEFYTTAGIFLVVGSLAKETQ